MLLKDLVEELNHKQQVLGIQQDLLDQGWDDVTIKASLSHGFTFSLKSDTHKIRLEARPENGQLTWYAFLDDGKEHDDKDGLEPYGTRDLSLVVRDLGALLIEMQTLTALNKAFKVLRRDSCMPSRGRAGYAVAWELGGLEGPPPNGTNLAIVMFIGDIASKAYDVEYCWSNFEAPHPSRSLVMADDLDGLIDVCREQLARGS